MPTIDVLTAVHQRGTTTAADIDLSAPRANALMKDGLIRVVDVLKTGRRGRPAHIYRLTDKGRKRAKRALKA